MDRKPSAAPAAQQPKPRVQPVPDEEQPKPRGRMAPGRALAGLLLVGLILAAAALLVWKRRGRPQQPIAAAPPTSSDELASRLQMPDLMQMDLGVEVPARGAAYCGPVAVSNALMWLARDRPGLLDLGGGQPVTQAELVLALGEARYMATDPKRGTKVTGMLSGLERFLTEHDTPPRRLAYSGWRTVPERYRAEPIPQPAWIEQGLSGERAVWAQVGFYKRDGAGDFRRLFGHWMTLVAKGRGQDGRSGWVAHDPAPRSGVRVHHELLYVGPLEAGKGQLTGDYPGLPVAADGFVTLSGWPMPSEADVAVLDGAIRLDL